MAAFLFGHIELGLRMMKMPAADLSVKFAHSDEPAEVIQLKEETIRPSQRCLSVIQIGLVTYAQLRELESLGEGKVSTDQIIARTPTCTERRPLPLSQFSIAKSAVVTVDGADRKIAVKLLKTVEDQMDDAPDDVKQFGAVVQTRYCAINGALQRQQASADSVILCLYHVASN